MLDEIPHTSPRSQEKHDYTDARWIAILDLYKEKYESLVQFAMRICNDHHDAEVAVQASIAKVFEQGSFDQIENLEHASTWFHSVLRREAINAVRGEACERAQFQNFATSKSFAEMRNEHSVLEFTEMREKLISILETLPHLVQPVLRYQLDESDPVFGNYPKMPELSSALELTENAMKKRLMRGRFLLYKALEQDDDFSDSLAAFSDWRFAA